MQGKKYQVINKTIVLIHIQKQEKLHARNMEGKPTKRIFLQPVMTLVLKKSPKFAESLHISCPAKASLGKFVLLGNVFKMSCFTFSQHRKLPNLNCS